MTSASLKRAFGVALGEIDALGDVRRLGGLRLDAGGEQVVVQQRRVVGFIAVFHVDDVRQDFVGDVDQVRPPPRRWPGEIAATAATAWPSYSTLSRAMQLRDRSRKFIGPSPTKASSLAMFGKSAAVTTAFTPGSFSALEVSIYTIRACACGLRLTLAHSMPGSAISAPNCARPVTLSTPSGRIGRVPTTFRSAWMQCNSCGALLSSDFGGGVHHRADDLVVAGATAEVAGQPVARLLLGRVRDLRPAAPWPRRSARACRSRTAARRAPGTCAAPDAVRRPWRCPRSW